MKFIEKYPIEKLKGADYNPRKISETSFKRLQESLKKFGVVVPVIINTNNILIAGHQRTKAMNAIGLKETPVYISQSEINVIDEINFNLRHNMVETNKSKITITDENIPTDKFYKINPKDMVLEDITNPEVIDYIGKLLVKYDEFDGIVVDYNNNILINSEYAVACKLINKPCLCYKLKKGLEEEFSKYMQIDYGEYNFDCLNIKNYNQTYLQPQQRVNFETATSCLYNDYVIPYLKMKKVNPTMFDFGAGKLTYVQILRKQGFNIYGYEPFYRSRKDANKLNIGATVKMIQLINQHLKNKGKLFDIGICDTVINATINEEYEDCVCTACNALLDKDGKMFIATRNLSNVNKTNVKKTRCTVGKIRFLDRNNFGVYNSYGVWNITNFHSEITLKNLLKKYFKKVHIESPQELIAICEKPVDLDINHVEECLNKEFNFEYPNNYYHNKHEELVKTILDLYQTR